VAFGRPAPDFSHVTSHVFHLHLNFLKPAILLHFLLKVAILGTN